MNLLSILFLISLLVLNLIATRRIAQSIRLSRGVKTTNIVLIWIIPLIWALLALMFSDKPPKKTGKFERHRYMPSGYQNYYGGSHNGLK